MEEGVLNINPIEEKKRPGVKPGSVRGPYKRKRKRMRVQKPAEVKPEIKPDLKQEARTNTPIVPEPAPPEPQKTNKEVMDEIEDMGRRNLESYIDNNKTEEEQQQPQQQAQEKSQEKAQAQPAAENPPIRPTLNQEYEEDSAEYEETSEGFNGKDPNTDRLDANNELMNGSIMFVIWDMIIPGMAIQMYKMFASNKSRAKLDKIDRDSLSLTDDQKEEMEKMGLASGMAKLIFDKMPKWVAFLVMGFFFSYMNVKIAVQQVPD
jgi:hypothetical protein